MQKQYEREFVQHFSASKYLYGVSRNKYEDLIRRVGNTFGPNDKIRNIFEVKDCPINGEWVVRLVDKEQKRILLPLEDVFSEIESAHVKGNHKAKTPLLIELKQTYFYPTKTMVEFVLDRCPICVERKKKLETKVPDEPIHSNPTLTAEPSANSQRKKLTVPQDPITESHKTHSAVKTQNSVSVEATAERAFTMIKNLVHSSTSIATSSSHGPLAPPHCLNSPIPFSGKPLPAISPSKCLPSFLTSTPLNRSNYAKPPLVPFEASFVSPNLSLTNDSRLSVDSNFIRFLNSNNRNQSGRQYLKIIREETMNSTASDMAQNNNARTDGRAENSQRIPRHLEGRTPEFLQPIANQIGLQKQSEQIKKEAQAPVVLDSERSLNVEEETKNKILLELEKEEFRGWRKMRSRSNPTHHYYYNSTTGTSQNEVPKRWEREIHERTKKLLLPSANTSAKPTENAHSNTNREPMSTSGGTAEGSEFGRANKVTADSGGTLPAEISVTVPFNDTNDAMNVLFGNGNSRENATRNLPDEEDDVMGLRDFCDMFQQELADEFEIMEQGTVPFISKDGSRSNAPQETDNLNLENIPLEESFHGNKKQIEDKSDCLATKQLSKDQKAMPKGSDDVAPNSGDSFPSRIDSILASNVAQNKEVEGTICSDKIQLLDRQKLEGIVTKCSKVLSPNLTIGKPMAVQTARKRSFRPKEAIPLWTAETSDSPSDESSEDEENVQRPPPLLVHKLPKCKVVVKRITKKSIPTKRPSHSEKSFEHLPSFNDSSQTPNTSRRITRNSTTPSQPIKQEIFLCVKCTRTRTFHDEIAYHLHELARHRNCVSANEYLVDYMEKLTPLGLGEVVFCCLLCDQTFDCAEYWEHLSVNHNTKIGARHRRISRIIKDMKEGKIQLSDIKKEFLSDSEDEDVKDVTWKGRDGEWTKLELGRKTRKRGSCGSVDKRVKKELLD